ncbi:MAG: ATP-binding protein, partial [Chloroflexota bacterium]
GIYIDNRDANMIERSIINLVDNAIKYTPNGGTIEVGLRVEDGQIVISISDTGYGISEENIKSLFKRHFRIRRREHARVKGSGLGLFIVRSVAQHHAGDAFVESTFGEGSTFGIRIPLAGENLLGGASV